MALSRPESPILPPELEREIFETAAIRHPDIIPNLFLVSRRIYDWVGCVKYRTILPASRWRSLTPQARVIGLRKATEFEPTALNPDRIDYFYIQDQFHWQFQNLFPWFFDID
ncbi:hypothetical protein R3P38DRAFT_3357061 [Favolaschia claudopus]|uniref:F-box domain-containing protein n=1 Tax=Favolaschia claudopus TaxID=2862362 RepID=A0AAW0BBV4_9AGAR